MSLPNFQTPAAVNGVVAYQSENDVDALEPRVNATGSSVVGGSVTSGDILHATITNPALGNFTSDGSTSVALTVTVTGGDTLATLAEALATAIQNSLPLQKLGLVATAAAETLSLAQSGPVGNKTQVALSATGSSPTETFTPASVTLSGGSGPIIPLADFKFLYNGQVIQLKENRRMQLGAEAFGALIAQGSPQIK